MTYQEKVKAIYNIMADKTLSFGCMLKYGKDIGKYLHKYNDNHYVYTKKEMLVQPSKIKSIKIVGKNLSDEKLKVENMDVINDYVIGHPLHIGMVLHWMFYHNKLNDNVLLGKRPELKQPLPLNPTEERYPVIDFITSLLDQGT